MVIWMTPLTLFGALAFLTPAAAQETFLFRIPRAVTPAEPIAQLEIWASFAPTDYAFAGARFDVEAQAGIFSHVECFDGCVATPRIEASAVRELVPGQLHFPPPVIADTSNPIRIVWCQWQPGGFDPRNVPLATANTSRFDVYIDPGSAAGESRMATFTEGSGMIRVRRCYTDCDGTDTLDFFDFLCFQNAFATDDFYADCDVSGALDFFDFLCFQNEFIAGCP